MIELRKNLSAYLRPLRRAKQSRLMPRVLRKRIPVIGRPKSGTRFVSSEERIVRSNPHRVPTPDARFSRAILRSDLKGESHRPENVPCPRTDVKKTLKHALDTSKTNSNKSDINRFADPEYPAMPARQMCRRPQRVSHFSAGQRASRFYKKKKLSRLYFFTDLQRTVNKNLTSSIDKIILTRQLCFSRVLMYNLFSASTYRRDTFKSYRDPCAVK